MKKATQMHNQQQAPKSKAELQREISHVKQEVEKELKLWAEVFESMQNDQQKRSYLLRFLKCITDI